MVTFGKLWNCNIWLILILSKQHHENSLTQSFQTYTNLKESDLGESTKAGITVYNLVHPYILSAIIKHVSDGLSMDKGPVWLTPLISVLHYQWETRRSQVICGYSFGLERACRMSGSLPFYQKHHRHYDRGYRSRETQSAISQYQQSANSYSSHSRSSSQG